MNGMLGSIGRRRSHALVIGVDRYDDVELPNLRGAHAAAERFASALASASSQTTDVNIEKLLSPTRTELARSVAAACNRDDEMLIIYFAGHGVTSSAGELILAGEDCDSKHPELTGLSWETLRRELAHAASPSLLLLIDVCGAYTDGERVWQVKTHVAPIPPSPHRRSQAWATSVMLSRVSWPNQPGVLSTTISRALDSDGDLQSLNDIDGLSARLEKLTVVATEKADESRQARDAARGQALAAKIALVTEAEGLAAESTTWKATGNRFTAILDEWKAIKGVDRKADGELWKRFATARDTFTRRRGAHFATLDATRKQAQGRKDELVAEAETLSGSTEWTATANRLKDLMTEWKAAPRASKELEQKLWERFRAAQDAFFTRRSEVFSARDAESKAAFTARQELLTQAEALDVDADPKAAQAAMRNIQAKWHDAGRVSRDAATGLDRRLRAVDDKIREAMDVAWRRPEPSASPLLQQMREQVAEAEARLERAKAAGDAKRIREAEQALVGKKQSLTFVEGAAQ